MKKPRGKSPVGPPLNPIPSDFLPGAVLYCRIPSALFNPT